MSENGMKKELLSYLKEKQVSDVLGLWGNTKAFYETKDITMGGGFNSDGYQISVVLREKGTDTLIRFKVGLSEI